MKKSTSRLLSFALAIATAVSLTATSFAAVAGTVNNIDGTSTVVSPTYEIQVPLNVDIKINPLLLGGATSQIYSAPLFVQNQSNIPVEINLKLSATTAGTPKPTIGLEDAVLAASADIANVNKLFSMYAAPVTTIGWSGTPGNAIDDLTSTFAKPTSYIGVGTTNAAFTAILDVSDGGTYSIPGDATSSWTWAVASSKLGKESTAFKILGSVNKNAAWANSDIAPKVTWQFGGVGADSFANMSPLAQYKNANLSKATSGTSAMALTPRFRNKSLGVSSLSAALDIEKLELGATASTYVKGLGAANQADAFTVSAITVQKNGVADTTLIPTADLSKVTVTVDTTDADEKLMIAKVTLDAAIVAKMQPGTTYTITAITLKQKSGTTTYASSTNAGISLIVTPDAT